MFRWCKQFDFSREVSIQVFFSFILCFIFRALQCGIGGSTLKSHQPNQSVRSVGRSTEEIHRRESRPECSAQKNWYIHDGVHVHIYRKIAADGKKRKFVYMTTKCVVKYTVWRFVCYNSRAISSWFKNPLNIVVFLRTLTLPSVRLDQVVVL